MKSIKLTPLSDLKEIPGEPRTERCHWKMTGGDPAFLVHLSKSLSAGYYRVKFDIGSDISDLTGTKFYFDYGNGFNEDDAQLVNLRAVGGEYVAYFNAKRLVHKLRFDPSNRPGELIIGSVRIEPAVRWAVRYSRLASHLKKRASSRAALRMASKRIARSYREGGVRRLRRHLVQIMDDVAVPYEAASYAEWVQVFDTPSASNLEQQRRMAAEWSDPPLISVLMPTYNTPEEFLKATIDSVLAQSYPHWELCIADDASTQPHVRRVLDRYQRQDARISVVHREANGHISASSNSALELCRGEWVALLDHDDLLAPHALFEIADVTRLSDDVALIYSDEDKIDGSKKRSEPYFKPAWNIDLVLGHNFVCHLAAFRRDRLIEVGGFREGYEGSQDHDLVLRYAKGLGRHSIVHIPKTLYHWRIHEESTSADIQAKSYAPSAGQRAIENHLERTETVGRVERVPYGYHVVYDLPADPPLVSVIVPTRDGIDTLPVLVDSLAITDYPNFEIIVLDNGSQNTHMKTYLRKISRRKQVTVVRDARPFNYSAINNEAVRRSSGSVLALINDDIEIIEPNWLSEMVTLAIRPDCGVVGARLLYPDGTLQHGGVIVGLGGVAGHSHKHSEGDSPGTNARLMFRQQLSAVTAACVVVRREVYEKVGGLDEELAVAFNDVDFCLRVDAAGYRNVWTPYATLIHHESKTRGHENTPEKVARFNREIEFITNRWGDRLLEDPFYSPCLTLAAENFGLASPPRGRGPRTPFGPLSL